MQLETGLIILESILLIVTVILLAYSIKEGKQRDKLLMEVSRATKVLSRQEYFLTVIHAMVEAKTEVTGCITGRIPQGDDKQMTRDIIVLLERLTSRGVRVKYLLPKFPDRLHIGYLYTKAGAEVCYSNCLMVHNMRFIIVDGKTSVIGIPESTGEKEATKKGYRIPSEGLASVLEHYFNSCEKQLSFIDYLKEVMSYTGATLEHLAHEIQIDAEELKKLIG
ncbi:MAG: hypothetical protein Q7U10_05710 [Thermodesulfovibrionia bacterium]|nr:hypothetical protein [Thermodesulfovibrionia bacterium]